MSLVAKKGSNFKKEQRDLPAKGMRTAVLTGIVDLGIQAQEYQGEKKPDKREILPIFHLTSDVYTDHEGVERPHVMSPFPLKLCPGADRGNYHDFCEAIDPNGEVLDAGAGDLSKLVGRPIMVKVVYSAPAGDEKIVYANLKGYSELPEGMPFKEYEGDTYIFDSDNPDKEIYKGLWPSTKDKIKAGVHYTGSALETFCVEVDAELAAGNTNEIIFDDDIPF